MFAILCCSNPCAEIWRAIVTLALLLPVLPLDCKIPLPEEERCEHQPYLPSLVALVALASRISYIPSHSSITTDCSHRGYRLHVLRVDRVDHLLLCVDLLLLCVDHPPFGGHDLRASPLHLGSHTSPHTRLINNGLQPPWV